MPTVYLFGNGACRPKAAVGRPLPDNQHLAFITAGLRFLNWRALHGTVAAKHAAIARLGFQQGLAARALVKVLASIGGHDF